MSNQQSINISIDRQLFFFLFRVYKASYHGYYITSRRNITIDSCVSIENQVGFFTFIIGLARK